MIHLETWYRELQSKFKDLEIAAENPGCKKICQDEKQRSEKLIQAVTSSMEIQGRAL
jgi:hypothetical protein